MSERQDIVFKGTKEGLYLILNENQEFGVLKEKLKEHLKKAEYFFQSADVILDTGKVDLSLDEILEIQDILAVPYGLRLKRIVHGNGENRILRKPSGEVRRPRAMDVEPAEKSPGLPAGDDLYSKGNSQTRFGTLFASDSRTLLHKGTLRSGQKVIYDGSVVILGDVNPGAEIQAQGDIVVVGALRGLAHAGIGNINSVVVAVRLEPTQLRIGDIIGRPPEGDSESPRGPEVARVKDGVILVEPLERIRWEGER